MRPSLQRLGGVGLFGRHWHPSARWVGRGANDGRPRVQRPCPRPDRPFRAANEALLSRTPLGPTRAGTISTDSPSAVASAMNGFTDNGSCWAPTRFLGRRRKSWSAQRTLRYERTRLSHRPRRPATATAGRASQAPLRAGPDHRRTPVWARNAPGRLCGGSNNEIDQTAAWHQRSPGDYRVAPAVDGRPLKPGRCPRTGKSTPVTLRRATIGYSWTRMASRPTGGRRRPPESR